MFKICTFCLQFDLESNECGFRPAQLVGWLCLASHQQRGHLETAPHSLSLAKDMKLGFYTVPTGN